MALFQSGRSTEREVEALNRAFQPGPGKTVRYTDIATTIGEPAGSTRFRTVTKAWRKRLERSGIMSVVSDGTLRFLTADEAQDRIPAALHRVGRAAGRLSKKVELIDPVDLSSDERRAQHSLERREMRHLTEEMRKSAKAILPPKPLEQASIRLVAPDKASK